MAKTKNLRYLCTRCRDRKPRSEFYKNKRRASGLTTWCRECTRDDQYKRYWSMTPEQREERRKKDKAYNSTNLEQRRIWALRRHFKMTGEEFAERMAEQGDKCAACRDTFVKRPQVDHDHSCCPGSQNTCGECVRDLLCHRCNSTLGHAQDSIERLYALITYLKKWN